MSSLCRTLTLLIKVSFLLIRTVGDNQTHFICRQKCSRDRFFPIREVTPLKAFRKMFLQTCFIPLEPYERVQGVERWAIFLTLFYCVVKLLRTNHVQMGQMGQTSCMRLCKTPPRTRSWNSTKDQNENNLGAEINLQGRRQLHVCTKKQVNN